VSCNESDIRLSDGNGERVGEILTLMDRANSIAEELSFTGCTSKLVCLVLVEIRIPKIEA